MMADQEITQEYLDTLDKRTNAYKDALKIYQANQEEKPDGLGDKVETVLEKTGIKKAVEFISGEDCGCKERKHKLNQLFPAFKPECLTEEEYNYLTKLLTPDLRKVEKEDQIKLVQINNRVFHRGLAPSNCNGCVRRLVGEFQRLLKEYGHEIEINALKG